MDSLKKSRRATRAQFTKIANLLEAGDVSTPEGEAQFILIEEFAKKLAIIDIEIEKILLDKDGDDAELEKELEDAASYRLRWLTIKSAYVTKKPQMGVYQEERNYKLPRLEHIKFDGNLKSWLPFWAQFEKIHLDQMMNENDKLQYLRQSMTPGTEVSRFIDSYPATSKSYQQAIADLKERYARNDLLIQVYVRELLTMILHKDSNSNSLTCLYDQISTQLRALEILGVTQEGYSSFILPMVESAIPLETLKGWERARPAAMKNELQSLLEFLKKEVESEQRIQLATTSFSQEQIDTPVKESTAAALVAASSTGGASETKKQVTCLWCDKNHSSMECYKLAKMSLEQRRDHIKNKKACLNCLKIGHNAKVCKSFVQCFICKKRHSVTLCPGTSENTKKKNLETTESSTTSNFAAQGSTVTLLQTTMVRIVNEDKQIMVRALVDNGSQRSYLRKDVAQKLGLKEAGRETLTHCLFSGVQVRSKVHNIYNISVQSFDKSFSMDLAALDQQVICNNLPKYNTSDKNLTRLLGKNNIVLADNECTEISLLIGADYSGYIMTDTMVVLKDGLIAIKTKLGWVLQGKVESSNNNSTNTLFCSSDISGFWSLELLGIRDPVENKSKVQAEAEAVMAFEESVNTNVDGRYEVSLPLKVGHEELLSNRDVAEKRLRATTKSLMSNGKFDEYHNIICSWETEGIVERVPESQSMKQGTHYLPHRGVSKDSSMTTKLRPVYDASACDKNSRSLNSYLNKGVNFLDKIPHLLTGFRKGVIGISADIAKAFLQISVKPSDRDYLRFLWWQDESRADIVEYRHCRVVFGLTSSPFLLSATIAHHLKQVTGKEKKTAEILAKSFYVDNCITSMDSKEDANKFIAEAKDIMRQAKFDLRQWATSPNGINETSSKVVSILGLMWNTETDELSCNLDNLPNYSELGKITKKDLMSLIQRIFDPIGFTCPVTLVPRLVMQKTWQRGLTWDEKLPDDLEAEFRKWYEHVSLLGECKIPRRLTNYRMAESTLSLHLFCDASKLAYGACVLLRSEKEGNVSVQMLSAKSRVAPPGKASIPRLELTATLIGSRLLAEVKNSLGIKEIEECCWTDSCVAYYWITKNLPWNVYVHNRVKEIRENSKVSSWHHLPGTMNWADVASRGCNAEQLISLRWWEGPAWLKLPREEWPKGSLHIDGKEACKELQKTKTACNADICIKEGLTRLYYFSKYSKIVRMMAWMLRFINNMQSTKTKRNGEISAVEYEEAEKKIVKLIQRSEEEYNKEQNRSLNTYLDEDGLLRVKTKLLLSDFPESTKSPALLPAKNIIVRRLVEQRHRELQHAGANQLTADIRTRFWIIGIRRLSKSVIAACTVCARFRSKPAQVPTAPLPSERVQCTAPFEVSGVDLAGPLFLRGEEKCWVVLFTCAVYRCVHLELTKSLSTEAFILTLRRFIARRGRIRQFICDNGTNFHGTKNRLAEIDWEEVQKQSTIDRIQWKMNAPTAAWWGGFFERLIRIMKDLLKRILGQSRVNYEELETILCECEAVMNQRPLTYVQDDKNTCLEPLTPACFLQCIPHTDVTDLDTVDANSLNLRLKYLLKLRKDFKQRFKNEYLTALVQKGKENMSHLNIGDIVLIETEEKRIKWPLGIIKEVYKGKDGNYRTAKVKTSSGFKIRPFQRLYPLEVSTKEGSDQLQNSQQSSGKVPVNPPTTDADSAGEIENISKTETGQTSGKTTRCGRSVKMPKRLNVLYERNWTRLVHEQLRKFESSIVAAARQSPEAQPPELAMDSKWTFSGSLIYCITLITTIGYGNVSPRTAAGRAATVAYAAAGVPLTLACLAGLGASLARLARLAWLRATKRKVPNTWRKDGEPENYLQLHEQQRLLPQPAEHNQYTSFPPRSHRSPGTVKARAGDRGQYSQVFERAPASPARAATLGRVKRSALADEPHTSSSLQTQTLDRKKSMGSSKCLATVHGPGRGRGRSTMQRPRGAVIEQLIAEECGELQMNRSQDDLDDSEDPDESICPHDTPSRVPLIWNEENHKMKSCTVPSSSASTSVQHHIHHGIEHCHIPVGIVLFLLLAYICVGAAIFSAWENWSFLDAAYFCFIALATIGFGDFVPTSFLTTKQSTEHTKSEYVQMIACCAYLVFGLILIAMSFSLLQDEVVARCSQLANSLGLSRQ